MLTLKLYRLAVDRLVDNLANLIAPVVHALWDPANPRESIDALTDPLYQLVTATRAEVAREARTMLVELAKERGVKDPYVPAVSYYPKESLLTVLRESCRGPVNEVIPRITSSLGQHVESAGRQIITRAVEDGREPASALDKEHAEHTRLEPDQFDQLIESLEKIQGSDFDDGLDALEGEFKPLVTPTIDDVDTPLNPAGTRPQAWARVLTGAENCGFCVMMASRGPVYTSAEAAGRLKASEAFRESGAIGYVNSYHKHCDCAVVPVYDRDNWPGQEYADALENLYFAAMDRHRVKITYPSGHTRVIPDYEFEEFAKSTPDGQALLDDGEHYHGITYLKGPFDMEYKGRGKGNQIIAALNQDLRNMQKRGKSVPVPDLRTLSDDVD